MKLHSHSPISGLILFIGLGFSLLLSSCVSTGSLKESKALEQKISKDQTIVVEISNLVPENEKNMPFFTNALRESLDKAQLFKQVYLAQDNPTSADLKLKLEVTGMEKGNKALRFMNMGGEEGYKARGELISMIDGKSLSTFDVNGNSTRKSKVSLGSGNLNFDTSNLDDLTVRAIQATCDEVVEYLKKSQ
jgi:hypothetical protein